MLLDRYQFFSLRHRSKRSKRAALPWCQYFNELNKVLDDDYISLKHPPMLPPPWILKVLEWVSPNYSKEEKPSKTLQVFQIPAQIHSQQSSYRIYQDVVTTIKLVAISATRIWSSCFNDCSKYHSKTVSRQDYPCDAMDQGIFIIRIRSSLQDHVDQRQKTKTPATHDTAKMHPVDHWHFRQRCVHCLHHWLLHLWGYSSYPHTSWIISDIHSSCYSVHY